MLLLEQQDWQSGAQSDEITPRETYGAEKSGKRPRPDWEFCRGNHPGVGNSVNRSPCPGTRVRRTRTPNVNWPLMGSVRLPTLAPPTCRGRSATRHSNPTPLFRLAGCIVGILEAWWLREASHSHGSLRHSRGKWRGGSTAAHLRAGGQAAAGDPERAPPHYYARLGFRSRGQGAGGAAGDQVPREERREWHHDAQQEGGRWA